MDMEPFAPRSSHKFGLGNNFLLLLTRPRVFSGLYEICPDYQWGFTVRNYPHHRTSLEITPVIATFVGSHRRETKEQGMN